MAGSSFGKIGLEATGELRDSPPEFTVPLGPSVCNPQHTNVAHLGMAFPDLSVSVSLGHCVSALSCLASQSLSLVLSESHSSRYSVDR